MTKTLLDHLDEIYVGKRLDYWENLSDEDKKSFNTYMIGRFLSMNTSYLPIVNELQQYWEVVKPREVYLFYSQLLPSGKQFNKYIKAAKEASYEDWVLVRIMRYFQISSTEAKSYLDIYYKSSQGREKLREILVSFGHTDKEIKKVGL